MSVNLEAVEGSERTCVLMRHENLDGGGDCADRGRFDAYACDPCLLRALLADVRAKDAELERLRVATAEAAERVMRADAEVRALRGVAEAAAYFVERADAAIAERERPRGGQSCAPACEFGPLNPSHVRALREHAERIRAALSAARRGEG